MLLLNPLPQRLDTGATPTFAGLLAGDGTAAAPSISFASQTNKGFYHRASNQIGLSLAGSESLIFTTGGGLQGTSSNGAIFNSSGGVSLFAGGTNQNVTLTPSGTGATVLSNGGNVASIWTGYNYSASELYFKAGATSGVATANALVLSVNGGVNIGGFGSVPPANGLVVVGKTLLGTTTDSGALLQVGTNTTTSAGGMVFGTDSFLFRGTAGTGNYQFEPGSGTNCLLVLSLAGTRKAQLGLSGGATYLDYDGSLIFRIGYGGTTALTLDASQNATFAGDVATANAKAFYWGTRSVMTSPSDGVIRLANSAGTDFTRLQFGGTTASFPALARSGTNLLVVDATGGSYTPILASNFWATGSAVTVSAGNVSYGGSTSTTVGAAGSASPLPALPTGYIIINVAGTPAKLPYYLA